MFRWFRQIDDHWFSPPHKFETILLLISVSLDLYPAEREELAQEIESAQARLTKKRQRS